MLMRGGEEEAAPAAGGGAQGGGQIPTVTVVVPGRSEVARTVTASGALAARRDQPVGIAGEGGRVTRVLVDAGSWVRAGPGAGDRRPLGPGAAGRPAGGPGRRSRAPMPRSPRTNYERGQSLVWPRLRLQGRDRSQARRARRRECAGARRPGAARRHARPDRPARHPRSEQRPDPGAQRRGRPDRRPGLGRACSASREAARWKCGPQLSQQDLAFVRAGMPASVTPIGLDRSFAGQVWQVSPVIDPQSPPGRSAHRHPLRCVHPPGRLRRGADRRRRDHRAAASAKRGAER